MRRKTVDLASTGNIRRLLFELSLLSALPHPSSNQVSPPRKHKTLSLPIAFLPFTLSFLYSLAHLLLLPWLADLASVPAPPETDAPEGTSDLLCAKSKGPFPVISYGLFLQIWMLSKCLHSQNPLVSWFRNLFSFSFYISGLSAALSSLASFLPLPFQARVVQDPGLASSLVTLHF